MDLSEACTVMTVDAIHLNLGDCLINLDNVNVQVKQYVFILGGKKV